MHLPISIPFLTTLTLFTTVVLALPAPSNELSPRFPTGSNIILPSYITVLNMNTKSLEHNPGVGKVNSKDGTSTVFTFNIPANTAGRKCSLGFSLENADDKIKLGTGDQIFMIFSRAAAPPQTNINSWTAPGFQRVNHIGNLKVAKGAPSQVYDFPRALQNFDCQTMQRAWEVTSWSNTAVEWANGKGSGLYVQWS